MCSVRLSVMWLFRHCEVLIDSVMCVHWPCDVFNNFPRCVQWLCNVLTYVLWCVHWPSWCACGPQWYGLVLLRPWVFGHEFSGHLYLHMGHQVKTNSLSLPVTWLCLPSPESDHGQDGHKDRKMLASWLILFLSPHRDTRKPTVALSAVGEFSGLDH